MACLVGVAAVAAGKLAPVMWAMAVGGLAVASMTWIRVAWNGVRVTARFEPRRAFMGEPITLHVRVVNDKRLPLPMVRLGIWLPPGLNPIADPGSTAIRGYQRRLAVPARASAEFLLPVEPTRRGEFWLERVEVDLSDPFDLVPLRRTLVPDADMLVMPEARIRMPVDVRRKLPFGRPALASRMFEERERFAGVRPYEPGDPLNRIHWKLTGHAGGLQTKLFEPTRSADVLLALDLSVGEPFWNAIYPDIAEDTIGWASFLARQAMDEGWRVGLIANTHLTRGRGPLRVPPGSVTGNEAAIFAALARMPNEPTSDLGPVLREHARKVSPDTALVVVTPRPGARLRQELGILRRRGAAVVELSPLEATLAGSGP
ncbi:MAG: DUF58 domain-containing protein, partial [Actinomycetota bacterium]